MMRREIMFMKVSRRLLYVPALALCLTWLGAPAAKAAEIDGAWSTSPESCKKVFTKKGKQVVLARDADFYGSGFVIDGPMIRGKLATCKITSMKENGGTFQLQTACTTDISVSTNQFELKKVDADKIMRAFPGLPEMDTPYYRCKL
jgi:hypothetical protein